MIKLKKNSIGMSLIELVVFIVVIGLAVGGVFLSFSTALQKNPLVNPQTTANELASGRMEIIIGKRRTGGFAGLTDPCVSSPPAVCTVPAGIPIGTDPATQYNITSSLSTISVGTDANYTLIDVTVTGPQNAKAEVKTVVAAY